MNFLRFQFGLWLESGINNNIGSVLERSIKCSVALFLGRCMDPVEDALFVAR